MDDIIIIVILLAIVGLASWYVIRAKKNGKKCIGCPESGCSSGNSAAGGCCCGCGGRSSCGGDTAAKE